MVDALSYCRQQGYSKPEIAYIQRIVGSDPNGAWGSDTIAAIMAWQVKQGITADGMVKRSTSGNTWPKLLAAGADAWWQGKPGISRVGLWTFSDEANPSNSASARTLQTAVDAKLTDISFTLTGDTNSTFTLLGTVDGVVEVGRSYKAKGIDVSLNMFVFPSIAYIDALADAVLAIDQKLGLRRLDIDAEELWIEHGFPSDKDNAAKRLGERLRGVKFSVAINGIVYTSRTSLDPLVRLDCVTQVTPQAYSLAGKTTEGKPNRTYNPIDLQATAESMWGGWWPDRQVIGGFATFNQAGVYELGTLDEDLALGLAMRTWADLGVTEVFGWSSKTISAAASAVFRKRSP